MCATKLVEVNVQGILIIVIIKIELIECLYHNVITLPKFKVENMNNVKLQEIIYNLTNVFNGAYVIYQ